MECEVAKISKEVFIVDKRKTEIARKKQIERLIMASSSKGQCRIRHRDNQGLCWRAELQELEKQLPGGKS